MFFNKWMVNKLWYIHAMELYLAIKKNELLILTTTCMNIQRNMLSKEKANLKDYCTVWFYLYDILEVTKLQEWRTN